MLKNAGWKCEIFYKKQSAVKRSDLIDLVLAINVFIPNANFHYRI